MYKEQGYLIFTIIIIATETTKALKRKKGRANNSRITPEVE